MTIRGKCSNLNTLRIISQTEEDDDLRSASGPVQSIDRVFDIIEILATAPSGLLLSDVAAASGLHVSTAHRLLTSLIDRGYARKDHSSGKYCLTLRFFEVGCRVSGAMDLLSLARPLLDALSDFSQEAVHLVKRDGAEVVYLYKAVPVQMLIRMASYVGGRNPLYCTGVGKCILAHLPEKEVEEIWAASDVHSITENTIVDINTLKKQLSLVRQTGYAIDNEENEKEVFCMAAPIFDWQGQPVAAVSVSAPLSRMTDDAQSRILPKLLETTSEISSQLGYCPSV